MLTKNIKNGQAYDVEFVTPALKVSFKYVFPAQINMFLAYLHRKIRE